MAQLRTLDAGDLIGGDYKILYKAQGGMGIAYICEARGTSQKVVLKTIRDDLLASRNARSRFMEEARIWVSLGCHEHIVWAHKAEIINERPYLILEYGGGWNLRNWIQDHQLDLPTCLDIALEVAAGMRHAQSIVPDIVHRDLKPENVLLKVWTGVNLEAADFDALTQLQNRESFADASELEKTMMLGEALGKEVVTKILNVKVTDFGLAKAIEDISSDIIADDTLAEPNRLRRTENWTKFIGTPMYMSPEQFLGNPLDGRSDIYSFGLVLYEMLTRRLPYAVDSSGYLLRYHPDARPQPLKELVPQTPERLNQLVMRCLEELPEARYPSFATVYEELSALRSNDIEDERAYRIYSMAGNRQSPAEVLANKGVTLITFGDIQGGIGYFEQALTIAPDNLDILHIASRSLVEAGLANEALSMCEKALSIDPGDYDALNDKGIALAYLNHPEEALRCFEQLLEIDPLAAEMHVNMGAILCDYLGQPAAALVCFTKATQLNPNLLNAWLNRGIAQSKLGHFQEALESFDQALKVDPSCIKALLRAGALLNDQLGHPEEALRLFESALRLAPESAEAWHDRGVALQALGRVREALESYRMAIEYDPDAVSSLQNLGLLLFQLGDFKQALQCFQRALEIDPGFVNAYHAYQECLRYLG
jgi:tetratricopeptide (TPR) repeat protein